jgi:hypothetical protein
MSFRRFSRVYADVSYACEEPGCLIRYDGSGYFIATPDSKAIAEEITPSVTCPNDERRMYLAEVRPEKRSFRLWKCPLCSATRTNEEFSGESGRGTSA